jgi:hypothetical protein
MAVTVPYSFTLFLQNIAVSQYSKETAEGRENRIRQLLEDKFEILDIFSIGSLPKATAVKRHGDLDIMVVLHYTKHIKDRDPSAVLLSIKRALDGKATKIRRDGQAVSLEFTKWPNVDIVPVSRTTNEDNSVRYYNVPNMNNEAWIKSRPRLHASNLAKKNSNTECGHRFKELIKMAKWWNYENGSFLSSYHVEIIALNSLYGFIEEHPFNLYWLFKCIQDKAHTRIFDGLNYVSSDLTYAQREIFDLRIGNAVKRLDDADTCVRQGKEREAIEKYKVVFGDEFPTYG